MFLVSMIKQTHGWNCGILVIDNKYNSKIAHISKCWHSFLNVHTYCLQVFVFVHQSVCGFPFRSLMLREDWTKLGFKEDEIKEYYTKQGKPVPN